MQRVLLQVGAAKLPSHHKQAFVSAYEQQSFSGGRRVVETEDASAHSIDEALGCTTGLEPVDLQHRTGIVQSLNMEKVHVPAKDGEYTDIAMRGLRSGNGQPLGSRFRGLFDEGWWGGRKAEIERHYR